MQETEPGDTVTGPREVIRRVLEGMRWASSLYQVPAVGWVAAVGALDDTGLLRLGSAGQTETVFDLSVESVTNLARPASR